MPTLPAESVARAALRWLRLLRSSPVAQAWAIVRADSSYTDLTQTQYAQALDWLAATGFLSREDGELVPTEALTDLSSMQIRQLLFARTLESWDPPWLLDADILVADSGDIPQDALALAGDLGLADTAAYSAIREVHGRIDLQLRSAVGIAGELGLVRLLEAHWPGSTTHVALTDDGFGYDISFSVGGDEWHLEVKATTRRGRLVIHLSRHEYEVARADPRWRLVVVGLREDDSLAVVATVDHERLLRTAPKDIDRRSTWQSVRYQVSTEDLEAGLSFLGEPGLVGAPQGPQDDGLPTFAWMPLPSTPM